MAGLLGSIFDPLFYQNGAAGLLSRLQPMVNTLPQSAGFPQQDQSQIAVGDYQMPRMGNPDLFQPQQVNIPQNAQPAQGQMPQQAPGFLDRLNAGFQSIGNGGSLIGAATGNYTDAPNQTQKFLVARGLDPNMAKVVTSDPRLLQAVLPQVLGVGGQTEKIKEFNFAQQNPAFAKYLQNQRSTNEYSLTPQYGTNEKGETVLIQTGKSGEAIETKLPAGVKISSGVEKVDLGTEWGLYDKRTGNLVGRQPKDLKGKESAEEEGKIQGQARGELPAVEMTAKRTIDQIDQFISSKGFNQVFGALDQFRPNFTMDDAGRDALAKFKQLSGRAFLEGRVMLKGGGAITDFESAKAEAAIARLERSLSENDAKVALEEFKDAVREGAAKLRAKAGVTAPTQPAASTPQRIRLNPDGTIAQ